MERIVFYSAVAAYVCALIVLIGCCCYKRFQEILGSVVSTERNGDLFVLKDYCSANFIPKLTRYSVVECLTLGGLCCLIAYDVNAETIITGIPLLIGFLSVSFLSAWVLVRLLMFLGQVLADFLGLLFFMGIACAMLWNWKKLRL